MTSRVLVSCEGVPTVAPGSERSEAISETPYGRAIREFAGRCPNVKQDMIRGMLTLCAIIDLALNPLLDDIRARS